MSAGTDALRPEAYPPAVWQRFLALERTGTLGVDALQLRADTPASRAVLELSIRPAAPVQARFRAYGCPFTIAVGAWLAECAETGLDALLGCDAAQIRRALEIPEARAHCALMGEDLIRALREALQR